ncbi:heterokaryon incompatibility protein-domain-containing protein [Cercophora newfieldiana]|uniref:Heterokaryon incompatibility protein-domain-containing protein n=1 Tax=Cercophora newfieldiana TaxID=92897 RepID=A0AA40CUU3_9PEZI|nr:heterokaryon incompatibility protein-domain-containing protein [Cercophora newfieldiana]
MLDTLRSPTILSENRKFCYLVYTFTNSWAVACFQPPSPAMDLSNAGYYRYLPLSSPTNIRVLHLSGGTSDNLVAELVETTTKKGIPYEAISYAWGSPNATQVVHLRGGGPLKISTSLYNTLKSVRPRSVEDGARTIWADGICINQADNKEKSHQVQNMANVYRFATGVITYIGETVCGYKDAKKSLELVDKLIQLAESRKRRSFPVDPVMRSTQPQKFGLPPLSDNSWNALREFILKPWSTRMWIIQESLLNANIRLLWGDHGISWNTVRRFALEVLQPICYPQMSGIVPSEAAASSLIQMCYLREVFRAGGGGQHPLPMLEMLALSRDLGCTDPRDRIFALAAINESGDQMPKADYSEANTTRQVFVNAAAGLLQGRTGALLLCYAGVRQSVKGLPTWAPDWTIPIAQIPVFQCRTFCAGGWSESVPLGVVDASQGTLKVEGIIYDRIVHLTEKLHRGMVTARIERSRWARDQIVRLLKLGNYPSGGSYMDALWRTLICNLNAPERDKATALCNRGRSYIATDAPPALAHDFEAWVRADVSAAKKEAQHWLALRSGTGGMTPPPTDPFVEKAWRREQNISEKDLNERDKVNIFKSLGRTFTGSKTANDRQESVRVYHDTILRAGNLYRRLCTTEKGYIGVVPDEARVGDALLFIPRAPVPFVIREVGTEDESYWLVGDCYVHGLMSGRVFDECRRERRTVTLV